MLKLNLKNSFLVGGGIIISLLLGVFFLNIRGLMLNKKNTLSLVFWNKVDMTLNEEVIEPLLKTEKNYLKWTLTKTPEDRKSLEKSLAEVGKGLGDLETLAQNNDVLRNKLKDMRNMFEEIKKRLFPL